jgi:hypothetical protein
MGGCIGLTSLFQQGICLFPWPKVRGLTASFGSECFEPLFQRGCLFETAPEGSHGRHSFRGSATGVLIADHDLGL